MTLTSFEQFQKKEIDSLNKKLFEATKRIEELTKEIGDYQVKNINLESTIERERLMFRLQSEQFANKLTLK
tara:strand:- start:906 stop:1118 length:213 start_codon:yes stop_codon:yes gene_type:complete